MREPRDLAPREVTEVLRIARGTAGKYGRILPGVSRAQVEDAASDAVLEVLRELHRWEPTRGTLGQWAGTIIARVVRRSLRMQRLPVSGSQWKAHQWGQDFASVPFDELHDEPAPPHYAGPRLAALLNAELLRATAHVPNAELGLDALLDGARPGQIASERGVPIATVTRAKAAVLAALEDSASLGALWNQKETDHDEGN